MPPTVNFSLCFVSVPYGVQNWVGLGSRWHVYSWHQIVSLKLRFLSLDKIPSTSGLSWRASVLLSLSLGGLGGDISALPSGSSPLLWAAHPWSRALGAPCPLSCLRCVSRAERLTTAHGGHTDVKPHCSGHPPVPWARSRSSGMTRHQTVLTEGKM